MIFKKHLINYLGSGLLLVVLLISMAGVSNNPNGDQSSGIMIVLIIILILKIISIVYEKVELMSDRMKYKKLKYFIFPQTYEIPYNKINDLEMTTYISGLSKIKVLTGNNSITKLNFFKNPELLKEELFQKSNV